MTRTEINQAKPCITLKKINKYITWCKLESAHSHVNSQAGCFGGKPGSGDEQLENKKAGNHRRLRGAWHARSVGNT